MLLGFVLLQLAVLEAWRDVLLSAEAGLRGPPPPLVLGSNVVPFKTPLCGSIRRL